MTWLLAVVLRPFAAFVLFGAALSVAYLLRPLLPEGRIKRLLYDRTFRTRHQELFAALVILCGFGLVFFAIYMYR